MGASTILLVDDETGYTETLAKRLRRRDQVVFTASGGLEALDILSKEGIDVAVVDVRMPEMDGLTLLSAIKKQFPTVEVIMLTGHADVSDAVRGMEGGAFDYLMKPIELDELLYKIEDAHAKKRLGVSKPSAD